MLLVGLAILSVATQEVDTFIVLTLMILLSIGLRFWQERKNNVAVNDLIKFVEDMVLVIRNGSQAQLPTVDLVPGDIVRLTGGDVVPADVILVDTSGLYVSQSMLTGESQPVLKQIMKEVVAPHSVLEASNICFSGSTVVSGSAIALVVATGDHNPLFILIH